MQPVPLYPTWWKLLSRYTSCL